MARQKGGVVDDGAVSGVVDHLHGDELGAEGQHVQLCTHCLVLVHHIRDGLALQSPARELEHRHAILLCLGRCQDTGCRMAKLVSASLEHCLIPNEHLFFSC